MAAFRISAKRFGTRTDASRQAGISRPRCMANPQAQLGMDREMLSRYYRGAYRLHRIEGGRLKQLSRMQTIEYGKGTSCKSAIANPVGTIEAYGYRWLEIRQPERPAN